MATVASLRGSPVRESGNHRLFLRGVKPALRRMVNTLRAGDVCVYDPANPRPFLYREDGAPTRNFLTAGGPRTGGR